MKTTFRFKSCCPNRFVFFGVLIAFYSAFNVFSPAFAETPQKQIRIAIVFDKGGKDDRSFNASAYSGVLKAKSDLNAFLKTVEATDDNAFDPLFRSLASLAKKKPEQKFDLIIGIGFSQVDSIDKMAKLFPDQNFAIVDGEVHQSNVRSLVFEEHEGAFIVGAIAAITSKKGKIGFIGGMDIPLIRRFEVGFRKGAEAAKPGIQVEKGIVGVANDAFNNPVKAKELALAQYSSGVDVIFGAAGGSETGIFDAAEETQKFAIGVDSNQNWMKPGRVLTSMVKKVDDAVFAACKDVQEGKFKTGTFRYGLANQGVDYTVDSYNEKVLPEAAKKKAEELKSLIISGKLVVPDYYKLKK